ncbi:MAG: bifunctional UDP-N-acetylglucosamine diphosphorylase/glucosamine-1-phosphate N-acetyltransferase GlmU [Pseudomonadota bacterium]
MKLSVIILAAGQGTRMHSARPKVLQTLAGKPLLGHMLDRARALGPDDICVVYGHGGDSVREALPDSDLRWALQAEQLGTGHAVQQALPDTPAGHQVLVLVGDIPLVQPATLQRLLDDADDGGVGVLTAELDDASGYGRIVRDAGGAVVRIAEDRDCSDAERALTEINTGVICCPRGRLAGWLDSLDADNAQREYYLTDIVAAAVADGVTVAGVTADTPEEVLGINDRLQLAEAERHWQRREARALLASGVTLADPARVDVRGRLSCGRDVFIDVNAVFSGDVTLGDEVSVGPGAVIRDSVVGAGTVIEAHSVIDGATLGERCRVGPFARLRPAALLADGARAGNFVEIKKSTIGRGSKVNHLTYIGDSDIGADVNVGAGTITCNYDGVNKHRTTIGDGAFIGSGVELVAPVEVGAGATIGAGSTIARPAPAEKLTVARSKQLTIDGWKRPTKTG